jgi:D-xylose transport system substrate-binding protein
MASSAKEVKIGMAIDDLRLERWQKDRDIFVNKAEQLGAGFCAVRKRQRRDTNVADRKYDQPRRRCPCYYSL